MPSEVPQVPSEVPPPSVTVHVPDVSSKAAAVTGVPKRMWRRRSNRSTTWLRYRSVSGWAAKCSCHCQSSNSSRENR